MPLWEVRLNQEDSFVEHLLRLGPGVCDRPFLACGAFVRLLANHVYLRCHTYEKRIPDLATDLKVITVIGLFDFLEWNKAHIVDSICRRLR